MDFVRQQLAVVQDRLAALSASQKMLTAALAVIVVMTMLYWGKVSSTPDRVAVVPNVLAGDELAAVTNALRARGIDYTVEGGKVMVAADKQVEAFGELSFSQALPANSTNAIDTMFEHVTAWDSQGAFDARLNNARQQNIAAVMRTWQGVKKADVLITDAPNSALSQREPRTAISIQTQGNGADRRKIAAAARSFALNCVAGLNEKFMSVTVDSMSFGTNADGADNSEALEYVQRFEAKKTEQIQGRYRTIPGVLVQVTAEMDTTTKTENKHTVDSKNKFSEVNDSEHDTSTPVAIAAPAAEPGVVANTRLSVGESSSASGATSGVATDKLIEKSMVDYGRTDVTSVTPAGTCRVVGATVGVPHSYFVAMWRQMHGKLADVMPPEDELKTLIDEHLKKIRETVAAMTQLRNADDLTVSDEWDLEPIVGGPTLAVASPGAAANLTLLATGHARELAIGVLAVTSLFMVSRMVKKAVPSPQLALAGVGGLNLMVADDAAETVGGPAMRRAVPKSIGGEEVAAEVGDGGAVMFGHELDADVLETSQMIEQVAGFVKQNPDAAAQMIGRWMSHD